MIIEALSQLLAYVCVSGAMAFVALLFAVVARRWFEGERVTPVVIRGGD